MADVNRNKANAQAVYDLMFNPSDPRSAIEQYVGEEYRQHNPGVGDGTRPSGQTGGVPTCRRRRRLVVLHCFQHWPGDHDYAGNDIDIFRFDGTGKIVEHGDVLQVIPDVSANDNGMF